jgi:hypothetical protein
MRLAFVADEAGAFPLFALPGANQQVDEVAGLRRVSGLSRNT